MLQSCNILICIQSVEMIDHIVVYYDGSNGKMGCCRLN